MRFRLVVLVLGLALVVVTLVSGCSSERPKQAGEPPAAEEAPGTGSAPAQPEEDRSISVDDEELERESVQ